MDREAELLKEISAQKTKIEKLQKYIGHLETDGDRLNHELVLANSYRDCYDRLNLSIPILVVHGNLNVHYANKAFCAVVEIAQEALKTSPPLATLMKEEAFQSILRETLESKEPVFGRKVDFTSPSERRYKLTLDAIPMLNLASGEVLGGFEVLSEVIEHTQQQYLLFNLSNQEYALSVKRLRCIVTPTLITKMPTATASLLGVINLRGEIVPIVDIKQLLALERTGESPRESVVILDLKTGTGTRTCGFLVDCVNEVVTIDSKQIEPWLPLGSGPGYIGGIAIIRGDTKVIVDVDRILCNGEVKSAMQEIDRTE